MKPEMREKLAQLPFEEKIRKVGELIRLARNVKAPRTSEGSGDYPVCGIRNPQSTQWANNPKK